MNTCKNTKVNHWNIPRNKKCVIKLTNHFHGYNMTIWTDYLHELVSKGHYQPNTPCNRLYQINRVKSKSDTPSLITKVIRNDSVTRISSVTLRTSLIIKTIFRLKSQTMTGKTSGGT